MATPALHDSGTRCSLRICNFNGQAAANITDEFELQHRSAELEGIVTLEIRTIKYVLSPLIELHGCGTENDHESEKDGYFDHGQISKRCEPSFDRLEGAVNKIPTTT
jgi:hypothetical protein